MMAVFFFRADDGEVLRAFIGETKERLSGGSLVKNPFVSSWFRVKKLGNESVLCVVNMKLIYPNMGGSAVFFLVEGEKN